MLAIEVRGLSKVYHKGKKEVLALRGVDLSIERGECVAIMGPSGSGKSTLLHLLGCLDRPTSGQIRIDGENLGYAPPFRLPLLRAQKFGFIFQQFNLIPTLTALENVALGFHYARRNGNHRQMSAEMLERVGLGDRLYHFPTELSGGEQQRVAIARALAKNPDIVLGDELTGELDSVTTQEVMKILLKLSEEKGATLVLVTHNPEVAALAQRILNLRDGIIY